MSASNHNTAPKGLRVWWLSPPRSGMQRLICPWEYGHARAFGTVRAIGGLVAITAGLICLSYVASGWAALFLIVGLGNLAGGYWLLTIARSQPSRV